MRQHELARHWRAKELLLGIVLFLLSSLSIAGAFPAKNPVDEIVFDKIRAAGLEPAKPCSDAVFVRRVYLDAIGMLPTATQAQGFILDQNPNKRAILVDHLLAREEFADYWAMKWSDLLRIKAEFPINLWPQAAQAYHGWVRESLRRNMPFDQFARALLTANGSDFAVPQVNFYRAVQSKDPATIARAAALLFMGSRTETWSGEDRNNLTAFFSNIGFKYTSEWKEEIVFYNPASTNPLAITREPRLTAFPGGQKVLLQPGVDPRGVFADWLLQPDNPWFARNIVNRVWSWLLGRGIINPSDDIRADNPPSNPRLLACLERELVTSGYNVKHIYRLILTSRTYQVASSAEPGNPRTHALIAAYPLRRLEAETIIDAINQITDATDEYSSAIPEPYTYIPGGTPATSLPDGSITSAFLEMFGRPPRDSGLESERNNNITPAQKLWLLNSSQLRQKLEQSRRIQSLAASDNPPRRIAAALYLTILSRFPSPPEIRAIENYYASADLSRREATIDVAWALINTDEFLYRH